MTTLYKYRIYCTTDSKYEYVWAEEEPTTCPTDTAHTIDSNNITIVDVVEPNEFKVKEESIPTGGHYAVKTVKIDATKNTTTSSVETLGFPISALSINFVTDSTHYLDEITLCVDKDRIVGSLTSDVSPATTWASQNYTEGDVVEYNSKLYTCILNTVSNDLPTDVTYWTRGLRLPVSSTVVLNTMLGYYIKVDDLTNSDDVGRVISLDSTNNYIYVDTNLTNSFAVATPTYIRRSVCPIHNYVIGQPSHYSLGKAKIGGSSIPADTNVTIDYTNKSALDDKVFVGILEYLY
jgi:hypothetical protein